MELSLKKIMSKNILELKKYRKLADRILQLQQKYKGYSEEEFKETSQRFKERLKRGEPRCSASRSLRAGL